MSDAGRLDVRKTWKFLIGGAFVRSESGRVLPVAAADGSHAGNVAQASRKDARDAVRAARAAQAAWAGRTAYNRGQILYRLAEVLEARREELAARIETTRGGGREAARAEVAAAVEHAVHHAGWTDKLHAVLGGVAPVAAPYFAVVTPEPVGVVGIVCPEAPCLVATVALLAPVLAGGSTAVVLVSERHPLAAIDLGECLATSDVPGGVANLLTGRAAEVGPPLAAHGDIDALVDASGDVALGAELARACAGNVTRYHAVDPATLAPDVAPHVHGLAACQRTLELKTAWHPVGL